MRIDRLLTTMVFLVSLTWVSAGSADPANGAFNVAGGWTSVFSAPLAPIGGDNPRIVGGDGVIGDDPATGPAGFVRSGIRQSFDCFDNMPPPQPHCVVRFDSVQVFGAGGAGAGEQASVTLENGAGSITFDIPPAAGRKEIYIPQCQQPTQVTFWLEDGGAAGYQSRIELDNVTCGCEIGPPNSGGGITTLAPRAMPTDPFDPPAASGPLPFVSGEPGVAVPSMFPGVAAVLLIVMTALGGFYASRMRRV